MKQENVLMIFESHYLHVKLYYAEFSNKQELSLLLRRGKALNIECMTKKLQDVFLIMFFYVSLSDS